MNTTTHPGARRTSQTAWAWILGIIAALIVLFAIIRATSNQSGSSTSNLLSTPGTAGSANSGGTNANAVVAATTTVKEILSNPSAYVGKEVALDGEVERFDTATKQAFVLDQWGFINDKILVITPKPLPVTNLSDGTHVTVKGVVTDLVIADIKPKYDFTLNKQLEVDFKDQPFIAADTVEIVK